MALFDLMDTNRDGMIEPKAARKICERLGFHPEPPQHSGDPGSSAVTREDLLSWIDGYSEKANGLNVQSAELKLSQRYALLRTLDLFGGGSQNQITRKALVGFLDEEQHKVRPEIVGKLLDEFGDGLTLTRSALAELLSEQLQRAARSGGGV
eukprot:CAMPEP_0115863830 /NCGR_PEP_ID=MMETSP0287-20121206/18887_1 /TAXON_ID=412157 /ORGANISM="Chrysochromulina rotalis, Strain UIO044" /LENGTH=151 /DNA_ID=CAMNT_0003318281 /DNA_START=6 /DNA_END=461 /DNA_ORIENTATION=+